MSSRPDGPAERTRPGGEDRPALAERLGPAAEPSFAGRRVLVIDDNPLNLRVAAARLRRLGCEVVLAESGPEGLAALERDRYDLVFLDCQMPRMDGFEVCRRVRALEGSLRRTPIVAMTTNSFGGDRERCLAAAMDDYLAKPAGPGDLVRVLQKWTSGAAQAPGPAPQEPAVDPAKTEEAFVIDPKTIDGLRALQAAGAPGLLHELLTTFLHTVPERLRELREAQDGNDRRAVEQLAHSLRGSSGIVGAGALGAACLLLEEAAESASPEVLRSRVQAVHQEWTRTNAAVASLLDADTAPPRESPPRA